MTPPTITTMSSRPSFFKLGDDLRHERQVTRRERRNAHHVHVVLDGLLRGLGRRLEQRAHVDVEADVGVSRRHDLRAAVVTVLTQLRDHDARLTALFLGELGRTAPSAFSNLRIVFHFRTVNT